MKIREIQDKERIKSFLIANSPLGAEFLVSPEWQHLIGNQRYPSPLAVYNDQEDILALFSVEVRSIIGWVVYAYSPRGPVFSLGLDEEIIKKVLELVANFLKSAGFSFWRFESSRALPSGFAAVKIKPVQPQYTAALDLEEPLENLLAKMHQKTRYNIRLAVKKGVTIEEGKTEADFEDFWRLINDTKNRDGFSIHNREHYHRLFSAPSGFIKLLLARYQGQTIAAGLFCFYGNRVTYLHGASANSLRQVMAPFLLQWTAISLAKDFSARFYDFYGIDKRRWPGVTRFKRGFSGLEFEYPGTLEKGLRPLIYLSFRILKKIRKVLWWR